MMDVTKISQIPEDELVIRASYGGSQLDRSHQFKCRGRIISRTICVHSEKGNKYRWCQFPDTGQMAWINEDNIRGFKHKGVGIADAHVP